MISPQVCLIQLKFASSNSLIRNSLLLEFELEIGRERVRESAMD